MANTVPPQYKALQKTIATAAQFEGRKDIVTSYWMRFHCVQQAMQIDSKSPECRQWLMTQMDWLEKLKKAEVDNESIKEEVVGQSHMEQRALQLFAVADRNDRQQLYGKNLVKGYFTAAIIMECLGVFGEINEDFDGKIKYAKWRATHIHTKLSKGEQPDPVFEEEEEIEDPVDLPEPNAQQDAFQPPAFSQPTPFVNPTVPSQFLTEMPSQPEPPSPAPRAVDHGSKKPSEASIARAQKLSKFAVSSLDYDDIPAAIDNLERALNLLKYDRET